MSKPQALIEAETNYFIQLREILHKKEAAYLRIGMNIQELNDEKYDLGQEIDGIAKKLRDNREKL